MKLDSLLTACIRALLISIYNSGHYTTSESRSRGILFYSYLSETAGFLIAALTLDISMVEYYNQTINAVVLRHFGVGLFKAIIFGYLVAFSGCLRGMQCGRSASAVGTAATSAVVTAIVLIVVSDAVMTVLFNILKI